MVYMLSRSCPLRSEVEPCLSTALWKRMDITHFQDGKDAVQLEGRVCRSQKSQKEAEVGGHGSGTHSLLPVHF